MPPGEKSPPFAVGDDPRRHNRGGRPKKTDAERECEKILAEGTPRCAVRLMAIVEGADDGKALAAADIVLRRVFGNPTQPISGPDGEQLFPSLEQILEGLDDDKLRAIRDHGRAIRAIAGTDGGGESGVDPGPSGAPVATDSTS